jgi:hypothetical protein
LQTAIDSQFAGDAETTGKGATLTHDAASGRYSLTLNNGALHVTDVANTPVARTVDGKQAYGAPIADHRGVGFGVSALDYTVYGFWLIAADPDISPTLALTNGGAFVGGYVTPANAVPVTGSATYLGKITGSASEQPGYYQSVSGDVRFNADFAARSLSGVTSNAALGSDNVIPPKLNDITFSAMYDPSRNLFEGTTRTSSGTSTYSADASGTITGRFFGPAGSELGGVWTLGNAYMRIIGSFAAKRD